MIDHLIFFVLGCCFGSFYVALAWREIHGESILKGRSHCEACGAKLTIKDLVPVLSYLMLRGKCRYCQQKITSEKIYGELTCGIAMMVLYNRYGEHVAHFSFVWFFFSWLFVLSVMDLLSYYFTTRLLIWPWLMLVCWYDGILQSRCSGHVWTVVGIWLMLKILAEGMKYLLKKPCIGEGDLELLAALSYFLGWHRTVWCLLIASLLGLMIIKKDRLPFVPCICFAVLIMLSYGMPLF